MSSRKRKYPYLVEPTNSQQISSSWRTSDHIDLNPRLFIQAYEADIVRGPQAVIAQSLEVVRIEGQTQGPRWNIGGGLIRWGGENTKRNGVESRSALSELEDAEDEPVDDEENVHWVDRYDACLLLDALPTIPSPNYTPGSPSEAGWSDLPSDSEDTFFLTSDEVEDFRRAKRRRLIEKNREERLKARRAEDGEDEHDEEEVWGGSDEDPDDTQKELMRRTAVHIHSSPNPAQLEMRILANHGGDKRFAFLRGRWARAWKTAKLKVRAAKEAEAKSRAGGTLGGLVGYEDSDSGEDEEYAKESITSEGNKESIADTAKLDDSVKEARRLRAREWARKRRAVDVGES